MSKIYFKAREDWSVTDLHTFFHQLCILYNRLYVVNSLSKGTKSIEKALTGSKSRVPEEYQLQVRYVEIHSPAKFCFEGLGEVVEQLRFFWQDLFYANRLNRKFGEQSLAHQEKLNQIQIERERSNFLIERAVNLRERGLTDAQISQTFDEILKPFEKIRDIAIEKGVSLDEES